MRGLVGQEDCLIFGVIFGEAGPGDKGTGDIGSDLGMKMTEAKLSSESTDVSL